MSSVGDELRALDFMKTHVQRIRATDSITFAVDMLDLYQTPALPVVDDENRVIGIVTEGDLARAIAKGDRGEAAQTGTSPCHTVNANTPFSEASADLLNRGYKRTPVVDDEGKLIGALDRVDLLQWVVENDQQ